MSSLVLSPHFALVCGLVGPWLANLEASGAVGGQQAVCAHMANTPAKGISSYQLSLV